MSEVGLPPVPPNNWPYIFAVIMMALMAVVAILILEITRPNQENLTIITLILGFLAPTTLSLLALMKSQETHTIVNSELLRWKHTFAELNYLKGAGSVSTGAVPPLPATTSQAKGIAGAVSSDDPADVLPIQVSVTKTPDPTNQS